MSWIFMELNFHRDEFSPTWIFSVEEKQLLPTITKEIRKQIVISSSRCILRMSFSWNRYCKLVYIGTLSGHSEFGCGRPLSKILVNGDRKVINFPFSDEWDSGIIEVFFIYWMSDYFLVYFKDELLMVQAVQGLEISCIRLVLYA